MANTLDLNAAALDIVKAAHAAEAAVPQPMALMAAGAVGATAAAPAAAKLAPGNFCAIWAEAKPVLTGALLLLTLFPRIRAVAERLIAIGDQIAKAAGCT
ncbi:MAG TPA: hypothetical protein VFB16_02100 [Bauldia sp.]|nr:hypothetical protein [Bauldia sp.]